jgi:hypothetical protein
VSCRRWQRELRYTINSLAHERAQLAGATGYKTRYAEEKARLCGLVASWIEAGSTAAEALAKLRGGQRAAAKRETLKSLLQRLKEMG